MSEPRPGLQLVPKSEPAAGVEIAMMEIRVLKAIRGLSKEERMKRSVAVGTNLRRMAVLAAEIVAVGKDQLAAKVADDSDLFGSFLADLAQAKANAKALLDVVGVAEASIKIAIARIEAHAVEVKL